MQEHIHIDGLIGGGSVLRVAVPLAISLNKPIKITNIRANRPKPGLRTQHLLVLQLLAALSGGELSQAQVGSKEVMIDKISTGQAETRVKQLNIHIPTAASISLIIQALCNYVFISRIGVNLRFNGGGTFTQWSPTFDYVRQITIPLFNQLGIKITLQMDRDGFFPKGGAKGNIQILPQPLSHFAPQPLVHSDEIEKIKLILTISKSLQRKNITERIVRNYQQTITDADIEINHVDTTSPGVACLSTVQYISGINKGISTLGKVGLRSEDIGRSLAKKTEELIHSSALVDRYMGDQILVPLINQQLGIRISIPENTQHVQVNMQLINQILGTTLSLVEHENYFIVEKISN